MKSRIRVGAVLAGLASLIVGLLYYLSYPLSPSHQVGAELPKTDRTPASKEGTVKAVTTPPRTFKGRQDTDAVAMGEFSSNPKRDPAEQLVLDIAIERGVSEEAKVKRLLALIPTLSPDAQTLAMENATALIPDADYLKYRGHLLQLATTPEMREAVMDDSLTRGEELRLPNLLELMRTSTNENEKQEIREIFEAYLDKDYGPNPAQWEIPVRQWVAENTDS